MNRLFWLVSAIAVFITNQAVSQTQIHHTLHFIADSLSFNTITVDSMTFTKVNYAHENERICDIGNPELPVMYYHFIIPFNNVATQVTISNKVYFNYTLNNPIYPAQEPQATCIGCGEPAFFLPKSQIYTSSSVFPTNNTTSLQYGFFDGNCQVLTLGICPFEYIPITGQFKLLTSFDLDIDLVPNNSQQGIIPVRRLQHSQELYNQILSTYVENKTQINNYYITPTIIDEIGETPSELPAYEYVIITPMTYTSAFSDFITWKKQKGIDIGIVNIEDIFSNYDGDEIYTGDEIYDNAGKLRQYLYEAYSQGTIYALLAGDLPLMPIRYGWAIDNTDNNNSIIPTDFYFSDFNGNWNVDHDNYYGEPHNDCPDYFPDLFIGRLICSSTQDITNWVNKALLYEKNPGNNNASYLSNSFIIEADRGQYLNQAENIALLLNMYNTTIWKELPDYNSAPPYFPKGSDVVNELNTNHYGLMTWLVHGGTGTGESGIATMTYDNNGSPQWKLQAQERYPYSGAEPDNNNGLDNLCNYDHPFVIYSNSCSVAPFDKTSISNNGARNCGESFTVDNQAGGVAFLGYGRNGYFSLSYNMFVRFIDKMKDLVNVQCYPRLGVLESTSKLTPTTFEERIIFYGHNLIGDPECSLWTCIPETMSVSIQPQLVILNTNNCFQLTINNLAHNKSAVVTLYKEGELYERIEVFGDQQNHAIASFNQVNPTSLGEITFTVTSFGCLPYQESINIDNCKITISGTELWQDDDIIGCDIVINSGTQLTVKSELRLSEYSKIIVKPGGRLILDGCTLTNSCPDGTWQGIEVWGDSDAHQQEVNGGYLQGYVELKNGATIENAVCALRLRNPLVSGTSGGIVHANDAHFVNNALAVEASSYTNHGILSQREIDYHGWFRDCTFTVDEDFPGQTPFLCHASLTEVNGLDFEGCAFSADRSVDGVDFQCAGIHAYNASFKVTQYCDSQTLPCPSASVTRSSFSGFHRAVESLRDGQNTRTVMVRDADLSANDIGVYALNTSLAAVLGNTFTVGGRMDCSFGVYLEGVAVCQVEENTFTGAAGTQSSTYGVAVKNSEAANDIYRNQFSGLDYANLAVGKNAVVSTNGGTPSVTTGLTYTCNTNASNTIDFRIDDHGSYSGVQPAQGSAAVGAGNTFSGSDWHIYNAGDYPITYYYHAASPGQTPATAKLQQTTPATAVSANRCRTHYGDGPVRLSPTAIDSLATVWNDARQSYQSLARLYESLSQADNADTAMMASVADAMGEQAHEATMAAGDILRSLADSPGSESGAMRSWLAALECPAADRLAIASLLESGDPDGALDLALSMPAKYGNKQLDPVEQEEYTSLVKLYADLRRSGRTALELTEGEKTLAERIAAEGTGQAQSLARALVEGIGGDRTLMACPAEIASHVVRGDGEAKGAMTPESESLSGFAVSVIPTPAHTWITVEYTLPECCDNADFELASITGVKVMTATLDGNKGSKTLDLKGLPGGVYLYTVHCGNHNYNGKVVVTK